MIFDLDGTLVNSRLDFDAMRAEMGIPIGRPVLEYVEALPEGKLKESHLATLARHELRGAMEATLMPGATELLSAVALRELHQGILTRNRRETTEITLRRLGLTGFSPVVTREDGPPKPDPAGLFLICREWGCRPDEVVFVGDYRFDIQAGRAAGMKTILYAPGKLPSYASQADFIASRLEAITHLLQAA